MIKLIGLDMDGTVLNLEHAISKENKKAIIATQNLGIEVIIATGRGYLDAVIAVEDAGLKLPFICLNGAEWRSPNGELMETCTLTDQDVYDIMAILNKHSIHYDLFIEDYMYTKDIDKQVEMFIGYSSFITKEEEEMIQLEIDRRVEQGLLREVESYEQTVKEHSNSIYKILALSSEEEVLSAAKKELDQLEGIIVTSSGKGNLEINHRSAQKGIALEKYAKRLGISPSEMMVVGDSYNDISMMKIAGHAVAMGNAPEEIKEYCHVVTESNDNDGVAKAIEAVL